MTVFCAVVFYQMLLFVTHVRRWQHTTQQNMNAPSRGDFSFDRSSFLHTGVKWTIHGVPYDEAILTYQEGLARPRERGSQGRAAPRHGRAVQVASIKTRVESTPGFSA